MDPSASIAIIENDLRQLVDHVLGPEWPLKGDHAATLRATLEARKQEEEKRRHPARVPESLLAFSHLYELGALIKRQWDLFAPVLGEKREFEVLMGIVEDYRNAPAHSRELLPYERDLLAGVAGLLRTKVITFMSSQGPDSEYYPLIEWARDSFGNEAMRLQDTMLGLTSTDLKLQVGAELIIRARAWDPRQRVLYWTGQSARTPSGKEFQASGDEVEFRYVVTENDVGANMWVSIQVRSDGKYHRHSGFDHMVTFGYSVAPPDA